MEKNYIRFHGVRKLTQAIIEAHKAGKQLNPSGFRGHTLLFTYTETDTEYKGKMLAITHTITSTSVQQFAATLNEALTQGHEVLTDRAQCVGLILRCPILRNENYEPKAEVQLQGDDGFFHSEPEGESEGTQPMVEPETPESEDIGDAESSGESIDEVQTPHEDETLPETPDDKSDDARQVDWNIAQSLVKKDLEIYAREFNVELDKRKSKKNMIIDFKEVIGNEG